MRSRPQRRWRRATRKLRAPCPPCAARRPLGVVHSSRRSSASTQQQQRGRGSPAAAAPSTRTQPQQQQRRQSLASSASSRSSPLQPATATAAAAATRARSRSSPLQPAARASPQQQRMSPRSGRGSRCGWRSTRSGNRRMRRATRGGHGTRTPLERSADGRAPALAELTRDAARRSSCFRAVEWPRPPTTDCNCAACARGVQKTLCPLPMLRKGGRGNEESEEGARAMGNEGERGGGGRR